jgi:hypothetical protein
MTNAKPCLGYPSIVKAIEALSQRGTPRREICRLTGESLSYVGSVLCYIRNREKAKPPTGPRKRFTPDEDMRLLDLRQRGLSMARCAGILGRSQNSVRTRLIRLESDGFHLKPPPPPTTRQCMRCRQTFETPDNYRLCDSCRAYATHNHHLFGVPS